MISPSEQIREAVAALYSNDPQDWARGGREIIRITRLRGVEAQRLIDLLCGLFDGDTILIDARPTPTPDDALQTPTMPRRMPLRERPPTTPRIATAHGLLQSMQKRREQLIRRDDPRFCMVQRVAVDLIADVGAEMNALSLDMAQNIAEWRGGEISLKQIRWMAKTEAALRKRVA